jgi:hypothetical protein
VCPDVEKSGWQAKLTAKIWKNHRAEVGKKIETPPTGTSFQRKSAFFDELLKRPPHAATSIQAFNFPSPE